MQICRVPGAIANKYDDRGRRIGDFIVQREDATNEV